MSITDNATGGVVEPEDNVVSESQETSQGEMPLVDDANSATPSQPDTSVSVVVESEAELAEDADTAEADEAVITDTRDAETSEGTDSTAAEANSSAEVEDSAEDEVLAEAEDDDNDDDALGFASLGLPEDIVKAVAKVGFEKPSPIQAETIPVLLEGKDVVGQAQTGTGKTAAFALPLLAGIDRDERYTQALILAPTRELALQVADAVQSFADQLKGIHVLPIYGGQAYGIQLSGLRRGAQIIVGTPGRVIDHLNKGTLDLSRLKYLVLDEADEMLDMGFQEDVERILEDIPEHRQAALFSATMPRAIRRLAQQYLQDAHEITVKTKTRTATNIHQRYLIVSHRNKLDALTRILEVTEFEAMILFVRTKQETEEVAEKLRARGFSAAAINGDLVQAQRERTVDQLREGKLDILVATDVAARGLDVERISHVVNFDIPHDTESYVHRIGRTGRAGRAGEAIVFVTPRERRMLRSIERVTNATIEEMDLPTVAEVNEARKEKFADSITASLEDPQLDLFRGLLKRYSETHDVPMEDVAAALASQTQAGDEFLMKEPPREKRERFRDEKRRGKSAGKGRGHDSGDFDAYRIEVGRRDRVRPGSIVGAIANEAGLDSRDFGRITILNDFSLIDLPKGLPESVFDDLADTQIAGKYIDIKKDKGPRRDGHRGRRSSYDRRGDDREDRRGRGRYRDDHGDRHRRGGFDDRRGGHGYGGGRKRDRRDWDD